MSNAYESRPIECRNCHRTTTIGVYTIDGKSFRELRLLGEQGWLHAYGDLFFCTLACALQWASK